MADYDVVIIGGGPAGLAAGMELCKAKCRTVVLEKESFGGHLLNVEWIDRYPGFDKGVNGGQLASEMVNQATKSGLQLEPIEVLGIEVYSSSLWISCDKGKGFTATVVIIAGGFGPKKLDVPGEAQLWGKGVFTCAHCEGGLYADKAVVVCGGGDAAVTDALFLAQRSAKVIMLEEADLITATPELKEKAVSNPKMDIRCGVKIVSISGEGSVSGIEFTNKASGTKDKIKVDGVCVSIGLEPNTDYLADIVTLDNNGQIVVNGDLETDVPCILAAGEIRSGSTRQIEDIINDGIKAARTAQKLLKAGK